MSEAAGSRTVPDPSEISQPFWDATREKRLVLQRCDVVRRRSSGTRGRFCPGCLNEDLHWIEVSGLGTVYAVSVHHRAPAPELKERVPYALALVDLDDGVRLMTNVVGCDARRRPRRSACAQHVGAPRGRSSPPRVRTGPVRIVTTRVRELARDLRFPEGPVVCPDGSVLVSELAGGCVTRINTDGSRTPFANTGGGPNGLARLPDDRVLVCQSGGSSWAPRRWPFDLPGSVELTLPAGPSATPERPSIQVIDIRRVHRHRSRHLPDPRRHDAPTRTTERRVRRSPRWLLDDGRRCQSRSRSRA